MSEVIKSNRDESAEPQLPNTVLQEHIDFINLQASRSNAPKPERKYNVTCDDGGLEFSYSSESTTYSVNFTWDSILKLKEAVK